MGTDVTNYDAESDEGGSMEVNRAVSGEQTSRAQENREPEQDAEIRDGPEESGWEQQISDDNDYED